MTSAELSGWQHSELVAVGIGQHDGAIPADLEPRGAEGDHPVDLRLLIAVNRWSEVEALPVPCLFGVQGRSSPGDLRAATR